MNKTQYTHDFTELEKLLNEKYSLRELTTFLQEATSDILHNSLINGDQKTKAIIRMDAICSLNLALMNMTKKKQ